MLIFLLVFLVQPLGRTGLWGSILERWGSSIACSTAHLATEDRTSKCFSCKISQQPYQVCHLYLMQGTLTARYLKGAGTEARYLWLFIYIFSVAIVLPNHCCVGILETQQWLQSGWGVGGGVGPFFTDCTANGIKGGESHLFMNIHLIHINALCHEYLSLSWIAAVVYW